MATKKISDLGDLLLASDVQSLIPTAWTITRNDSRAGKGDKWKAYRHGYPVIRSSRAQDLVFRILLVDRLAERRERRDDDLKFLDVVAGDPQ